MSYKPYYWKLNWFWILGFWVFCLMATWSKFWYQIIVQMKVKNIEWCFRQVNDEIDISKHYRDIESLLEHFWKQWQTEYIPSLQKFQKNYHKSNIVTQLVGNIVNGEWPSRLRCCIQNRKVPGSNLTRHTAGLRDPALLPGSQWPLGWLCENAVINIGWVRLPRRPSIMTQRWMWGSQIYNIF